LSTATIPVFGSTPNSSRITPVVCTCAPAKGRTFRTSKRNIVVANFKRVGRARRHALFETAISKTFMQFSPRFTIGPHDARHADTVASIFPAQFRVDLEGSKKAYEFPAIEFARYNARLFCP